MSLTVELWHEITSFRALRGAAVRASRGTSRTGDVAAFLSELEQEVLHLQRELWTGTYAPGPMAAFHIREPKPRRIQVAPFRDRVVHHALCAALAPTLDRYETPHSYACRPGKGHHAAVLAVQRHARRHPWYAKLDVLHFFETVPHPPLLAMLDRRVPDARVRALVRVILEAGASSPGYGLPIGNLTSQRMAGFVLARADRYALEVLKVGALVRYMDDVVIFGPDRVRVQGWRDAVARFWRDVLGLTEKVEAARLAPVRVGVPFLGFRVWPRQLRLDGARVRRLRRRLRALRRGVACGQISPKEAARRGESVLAWAGFADTRQLRVAWFAGRR